MTELLNSSSGLNELESVSLLGDYRQGKILGDTRNIVYRVKSILNEHTPFSPENPTIRHIYYRLRGEGALNVREFQGVSSKKVYASFVDLMTRAREVKDIDWTRISDRSRTPIYDFKERGAFLNPSDSIDNAFDRLFESWNFYERSYWDDQPKYVEVWYEKDAMTPLFVDASRPSRVQVLLPCRGNNSYQQKMDALFNRFKRDRENVILYFGDLDPSGWNMSQNLQLDFDRYARDWSEELGCRVNITVKRVGLLKEQVEDRQYEILKGKKDSNISKYKREVDSLRTWELDVMSPVEIRKMVEAAVRREIDWNIWEITRQRAAEEKRALKDVLHDSLTPLEDLRDRMKIQIVQRLGTG